MKLNAQKPRDLGVTWRNLTDDSETRVKVTNLALISGVGLVSDAESIVDLCCKFITEFQDTVEGCNSPQQILEVYDKAKREYSKLEEKIDFVMESIRDCGFERISVANKYTRSVTKLSTTTEIFVSSDGDEESVRLFGYHDPKCFVYLYKVLQIVINDLAGLDSEDMEKVVTHLQSFILTIAHVYDDMEVESLTNKLEEDAFNSMIQNDLPICRELQELLDELIIDMEADHPLPYIRQFLLYCKSVRENLRFTSEGFHMSSASSGTYIKRNGKRYTVPSILSSELEPDPYEDDELIQQFDELVGFPKGLYPSKEEVANTARANNWEVESHPMTTTYIKQHKLKRRCIHMAINPIQDRLAIFRHALKDASEHYLKSDSASNQDIGRMKAKQLSLEAPNAEYFLHCCDIHDATGTNSVEFQEFGIQLVTDSVIAAKAFTRLTQTVRYNKFSSGKCFEYTSNRGQPQGTEPSFDGLTLMHYIVFLLVMIKLGLKSMRPEDVFFITGDDSVIWVDHKIVEGFWYDDSDDMLFATYRHIASLIGWEIHPTKGYHFNPFRNNSCTVEFCKQAYANGMLKSAYPHELFGQMNSLNGVLSMILWEHRVSARGKISIFDLKKDLLLCGYELSPGQEVYIALSALLSDRVEQNAFSCIQLSPNEEARYMPFLKWFAGWDTIQSMRIMLSRSTIRNKDEADKATSIDFHILRDMAWMDDALLLASDNPAHKLNIVYETCLDKYSALGDLLSYSRGEILKFASCLDEESRSAVKKFCDLWNFLVDVPDWYNQVSFKILIDAKASINKIQPYSMSRRAKRESSSLLALDEAKFASDLISGKADISDLRIV